MDLDKARYKNKKGERFDFSGWKVTMDGKTVCGWLMYADEKVGKIKNESVAFKVKDLEEIKRRSEEFDQVSDSLIEKHKNL